MTRYKNLEQRQVRSYPSQNRGSSRSWTKHAIILVLYVLLALAFTFPLILHITTHVSGQGVDDPAQTWSLWWFKFSLFNLGVSPLSTDYLFYPLGINLVAYTPTFLNGALSLPFQFASSVILAQNLILYTVLVIGGYGTFLLALEILSSWPDLTEKHRLVAAGIAGAFYAFGAWHIHYADATYMLVSNEWLPFYALYLLRLEKRPWRNGLMLGIFLLLAAWTELTFTLFLAVFTVLYLVYLLIARRRAFAPAVQGFIALTPITLLGISPLVYSLWSDTVRYGYYLAAGLGRVQIFSAEPISFFVPSPQHPLLGAAASAITVANTRYAFVGYAVLVLVALGLYFGWKVRPVRFWAFAALFFALVMLGPTLLIGGQNTGLPLPFALLREIPFVNANRYPVRFNVMLMLALAPLVAIGAAHLHQVRRGALMLSALVVLLAFEQLVVPIPLSDLRVPAVFQAIHDDPGDFAVLDLPLGWRGSVALQGKMDDKAEFYQTVHQKRVLGGITSRTPSWKFQYFLQAPVINSLIALESGREVDDTRLAQDRAAAPDVLRFFGIRYVEVNRALADPALMNYVLDVLPLTEIYRDDTRIVYRMNASIAPLRSVDMGNETSVLYFDDRWGQTQWEGNGAACRWATSDGSEVWLPLKPRDQTLTFRLRGWHAEQMMRISVNGTQVAAISLTGVWADYGVKLPGAVVRNGLNRITFSTETASANINLEGYYTIGDTGIHSPVEIAATGAGFNAGRFGEINVAGRNVIPNQRGYHLIAIDPKTGQVDGTSSFDTFADANASQRLVKFVDELPPGEIVAGVAIDDVSQKLQPGAVAALHQLGVAGDLRYRFRMGQAFIGVKGAQPGQALEQVQGRLPANVAVGKNVAGDRIAFALGGITIGE